MCIRSPYWSQPRRVSATIYGGTRGIGGRAAGDRANLLTLTAPEMTVLVGGLRALNGNKHGVSPSGPGR